MLNPFTGNCPDVFKNLSLGGVLRVEKPSAYVETHSGGAIYEPFLSDAVRYKRGRVFGVEYFKERAKESELLIDTDYYNLLNGRGYPCSQAVAISALGPECEYTFCDADPCSSYRLKQYAGYHECRNVLIREACGINFLNEMCYFRGDLSNTVALIDPSDPSIASHCGADCFDLLIRLLTKNAKVIFWHGSSNRSRVSWDEFVVECVQRVCDLDPTHPMNDLERHFEASLRVDDYAVYRSKRDFFSLDQHGIACFGFGQESFDTVRTIGSEMERIYQDYKFDEDSGALRFDISPLSLRSPMKGRRGRKRATSLRL